MKICTKGTDVAGCFTRVGARWSNQTIKTAPLRPIRTDYLKTEVFVLQAVLNEYRPRAVNNATTLRLPVRTEQSAIFPVLMPARFGSHAGILRPSAPQALAKFNEPTFLRAWKTAADTVCRP